MTRRIQAMTISLAVVLASAVVWQGCGGNDHGRGGNVTIAGNVSSVTPAQAKAESRSRLLAAAQWMFASQAVAQSSCPAHRVLVCVSNGPGQPVNCERVDSNSCSFAISFDVLNEFADGVVAFSDDVNDDGKPEGEAFAILTNPLGRVCPGSVVLLNDVTLDFTAGTATAASVEKDPDTCTGTPTPAGSVTATPTRTRTPAPTVTGTPPTPTPNATATAIAGMTATAIATQTGTPANTPTGTTTPYSYGASLNQPPTTWLAFLFSAGALGLILPHRRRRDRGKH
jgi:hypothetical protein